MDVVRVKEEIEARIQTSASEEEIRSMQDEVTNLIKQYEKLVGDKIVIFNDMLSNLKELSRNNDNLV